MAFIVIYTTHPDKETAEKISQTLTEEKWIACANLFPIQSAYWWKGQVEQEGEWVALLKTRTEYGDQLEERILQLHPYEVPCIMRMEVQANAAYEQWIHSSTQQPKN